MENHQSDLPIIAELKKLETISAGRRFWSWILFSVIAIACFILPLVASIVGDDSSYLLQKRATQNISQQPSPSLWSLDQIWNPGPLSNSHKAWANDCKVCHSASFQRVKDQDCLTCHQKIGDHVLTKHPQMDGLNVRCATCHQDHNGSFSLVEQNKHFTQKECASCHQNLKANVKDTLVENVSDFSEMHPNFKVQIADNSFTTSQFKRVRLKENEVLNENSGLKFPHDVHLTKEGVSSPKGKVQVGCANCHEPTTDQLSFKPVSFEKNCQSCHALKFEPTLFNREVPHGPVDAVLSTLREFYSYTKLHGMPSQTEPLMPLITIGRPGERDPSKVSFTKMGMDDKAQASAAAVELFEKTSCNVCHDVKRLTGPGKVGTSGADLPQWSIAAVSPQHNWMPQANFSHSAHAVSECSTCHKATSSKKSSEVLMPDIKVCKDCHATSAPPQQRVSADCGTCHSFHMKPEQLSLQKKLPGELKSSSTQIPHLLNAEKSK